MKRRAFLSKLLAVSGLTAFCAFIYPLARFLAPPRKDAKGKQIILKKEEIREGETKVVVINAAPVIVINRPGKGYIALSKVCTHLGCLVEYDKTAKRLICPCHAGTFDLEGNIVSGPPSKPLPEIPIKIEGENIFIG